MANFAFKNNPLSKNVIQKKEWVSVGFLPKPHGVKGAFDFTFTHDMASVSEPMWVMLRIDGILVPFVLEWLQVKKPGEANVKLEGIDTLVEAKRYVGCEVWMPHNFIGADETHPTDIHTLVGYRIVDRQVGEIGHVASIDDSTLNVLFVVNTQQTTLLIPVADEWIDEIDIDNKLILMNLPEGLLHL